MKCVMKICLIFSTKARKLQKKENIICLITNSERIKFTFKERKDSFSLIKTVEKITFHLLTAEVAGEKFVCATE